MASKGIESSMYQVTQHIVNSTGVRTPRTPLFAIPAVIHWHGLTGTQPIKRTAVIIKYFFCVGLKFIYIFAVLIILKGRSTACLFIVAGFFYACTILIQRFCTPVWSVNAPTALEVISSGKGRTVFYFCPNLNIWDMLITEKQNNCATCAQKPITAEQIVSDILIWDDPENIREDLHEMMLAFFMHYESPTEEFKGRIYCTYTTLYNALKQMEQLNPRRKEVCHVNA